MVRTENGPSDGHIGASQEVKMVIDSFTSLGVVDCVEKKRRVKNAALFSHVVLTLCTACLS